MQKTKEYMVSDLANERYMYILRQLKEYTYYMEKLKS